MLSPAERLRGLAVNPILAIAADCQRRRTFGQDIVDLSVGQPDFGTPRRIGDAACRAVAAGETRYPPLQGIGPLRVAVRARLLSESLGYQAREILVTAGATGGLFCAFQALLEPGDRVLIPVPAYPAYARQVALAGGVPVPVPTRFEDGFRLMPEGLRAATREPARLLVLNNPGNPTGAVYGREELEGIAAVVLERDLAVVADEIYSDFIHAGPPFVSFASLGPKMRERTILVRSLSKSYAMTGWRIGFAAGPEVLIRAMLEVQHAALVAPASVCQWAAAEALAGDQAELREMARTYAERHRLVQDWLATLSGVRSIDARGAFFAFPDLSGRCRDVDRLCRTLLDRQGVAVVPGSAFGAAGCIRISYAVETAQLAKGLDRLRKGLDEARAHGHAA